VLAGIAALIGLAARPAVAQAGAAPQIATWKTWVLSSADEIAVPAPPADTSDATKAELAELLQLQQQRTATAVAALQAEETIRYYNGSVPMQRWAEQLMAIHAVERPNALRQIRNLAILHTAMHDAVVAANSARYRYWRRPPYLLTRDLRPALPVTAEPSYPSEHAAVAAAAAGVLGYLFPKEARSLGAMSQEAAFSRLLAGANYRSDVQAGLMLGAAVAEKAVARAKADNSDVTFNGTVPTGAGYWTGWPNTVEPAAGSWKTWILTSGSQLRPPPPPAFGSDAYKKDLEEVKQLAANRTPSQVALANFWVANGVNFFWNQAYAMIARDRLSTSEAARVLALMGAAHADSTVAVWDSKFHYWYLRPFEADPTLTTMFPTPPYPAYVSGMAGFTGAVSEVLAHFFPGDATRLRTLAAEARESRLYAGIHFRFDMDAGYELAKQLVALAIDQDRQNEN
jgi:hypothetical protein